MLHYQNSVTSAKPLSHLIRIRSVHPGEMLMAQDSSHFLNELPIWKLKIVAEAFNIDVSVCRYKRDYVEKVKSKKLSEEQVRNALAKAAKSQTATVSVNRPSSAQPVPDMAEVGKELEQIAARPAESGELPREEEKSIERDLDEVLVLRPSFFEVDSASESAYNRMILGDYYGAIKVNRDARLKCLETFSSAQVYSAAVSIRAAEELLSRLSGEKHEIDPALRTALAEAKKAFINGPPRQREEALEALESLVAKAYEAFAANSERDEAELKALLADYESFGARTEEARRYLEIAAQAKTAFNIGEYAKFIDDAKGKARAAKEMRAKEINEGFKLVQAATAEAEEVGVDTSAAASGLGEVRLALDDGSFRRAIELLSSIEQKVDEAHVAQIRGQRDLEQRQSEKAGGIIASYEPMLLEASSYGMAVQDGLYHAANAKAALADKDVVRAVKHARRLKEIAVPIEKGVDMKRLELGIVKRVDGASCSECGQPSIYSFPDSSQKCFECGHRTSAKAIEVPPIQLLASSPSPRPAPFQEPQPAPPMPPSAKAPAPVEPKKKRRLLRW